MAEDSIFLPAKSVFPFSDCKRIIGDSFQANYLLERLQTMGTKTIVVEEEYIDKDYLIDYSNFYARAFEDISRTTIRIHFFKYGTDVIKKHINRILDNENSKSIESLQKSYFGFIVRKPIRGTPSDMDTEEKNASELFFIGRSAINPAFITKMDGIDDLDDIHCLTIRNDVSLFGIPLYIDSLPFQAQDVGVGACATVALWVASQKLNDVYQTEILSPSEITKICNEQARLRRIFPSDGLDLEQTMKYIRHMDLEVESIGTDKILALSYSIKLKDMQPIERIVKTYIDYGVPLIASLEYQTGLPDSDYHAVVISGYCLTNDGEFKCLLIHDDRMGPYSISSIKATNKNFSIINAVEKNIFREVFLVRFIIPIYPKIRLAFYRLFSVIVKEEINNIKEIYKKSFGKKPKDYHYDLQLLEIQKYKKSLLSKKPVGIYVHKEIIRKINRHPIEKLPESLLIDKSSFLKASLPRFIYICKFTDSSGIVVDMIFDATTVFPQSPLAWIIFEK